VLEHRYSQGRDERWPDLVRDLTQLRVHVIAAADSAAAGAVKEHAPAIPLVLLGANDPVGTGLVASLARPGGNITGLSNQLGELEGKVRQPLSYSPDSAAIFRRGADYIDKILRGARPAELPIEQPTKFELVINGKTAKAIGLAIPPSVLVRTDQVID
jgi:ABC-type uncharacterized transport system substrate-binding protein